jgi:hypothetical protein
VAYHTARAVTPCHNTPPAVTARAPDAPVRPVLALEKIERAVMSRLERLNSFAAVEAGKVKT